MNDGSNVVPVPEVIPDDLDAARREVTKKLSALETLRTSGFAYAEEIATAQTDYLQAQIDFLIAAGTDTARKLKALEERLRLTEFQLAAWEMPK